MTSSNPNHLPKAPSPNTITSGYGFNIWIRGTHTFGPWQVYTQVYMSHSMLRAHTHTWTLHLFPTSVHSEGQGVITLQYQRAKLAPWSWLLNTVFLWKGPGFLAKTASSRSRMRKAQDEPGTSYAQTQRVLKELWGHVRGTQKTARMSSQWSSRGQHVLKMNNCHHELEPLNKRKSH